MNGLLDLQEMKPTPRNKLLGLLADALTTGRDFADRAQVPQSVPLLGGQGLGSLLLGKAPEEVNELAYGNMPLRVNPLAGRTASFVPEMKPGRKQQVADLALALQGLPGGNRAALGLAGAVDTGAGKAAIVWHGSPHKFDKFDSSKIGTGEGAQAYGHGLYLADEPGVARSYASYLGRPDTSALSPAARKAFDRAAAEITSKTGNPALATPAYTANLAASKARHDVAQELASYASNPPKSIGHLYKVDLPDEQIARMLDWDKPLSQQAPEVSDMVRKAFPGTYINGRFVDPANSQLTGRALLDQLSAIADKRGAPGMRAAEPALKAAGIPGIRYLDGGSRNAGQGTSNFVVFPGEENMLRILERNGSLLGP